MSHRNAGRRTHPRPLIVRRARILWRKAIVRKVHEAFWHPLAHLLATPILFVLLLLATGFLLPRTSLFAPHFVQDTPSATATSPSISAGLPALRHSRTPDPLPPGDDWPQYRSDAAGTGDNMEGILSTATVAGLRQQWAFNGGGGFLATPAVVDGVAYATSGQTLEAIDLLSGRLLWQYTPRASGGSVDSSIAVDPETQLAFYGTGKALLFAIDLKRHTEAWQVQLGNPAAGAYIWSSPLVVNGQVYVGLASYDDGPCVRGAVIALDELTGSTRWTHYMVRSGALGGAVWSSLSADVQSHQVIATTGNPCPGGADFDQTDSIVALNWTTGATVWQYSPLTNDIYDWDFGQGAAVFTLHGQEYIVAGNKFGMVYGVTPPASGGGPNLVWSNRIAHSGFLGQGGIFEPPTYSQGVVVVAGGPTLDGACPNGALNAFQADTGAPLWRVCTPSQVIGSAAATGDLLFVPMPNQLVAYNIFTGQQVWRAAQNGQTWGGVAISRGFVVSGTLSKVLYCYGLPPSQLLHMR